MHETWIELKKLQLKADPEVFTVAAKEYIERSFCQLLRNSGIANAEVSRTQELVEANYDLLPPKFRDRRIQVMNLLKVLKSMDRQVDWYNGDFIDHKNIYAENEDGFNLVLELLKPQ